MHFWLFDNTENNVELSGGNDTVNYFKKASVNNEVVNHGFYHYNACMADVWTMSMTSLTDINGYSSLKNEETGFDCNNIVNYKMLRFEIPSKTVAE